MNLSFDSPAKRWGEALPIGNGHIGGMVYSSMPVDRIELTENTFYSGKREHNGKKSSSKVFNKMRDAICRDNYKEAHKIAEDFVAERGNYGTHLPTGQLLIQYYFEKECNIDFYHRKLDINRGVVNSYCRVNEEGIEVEVFASHVHKAIVYRMKTKKNPINANISFLGHHKELAEKIIKNEKEAYLKFTCSAREGTHSDGSCGVNLAGGILVATDGIISTSNNRKHNYEFVNQGLYIKQATEFTCYIQMQTDYSRSQVKEDMKFLHKKNDSHLSFVSKIPYRQLLELHEKDVKQYMERVKLNLEGENGNELVTMFQYGRYLLLSSSREDSKLPAHLQGIWNDNVACQIGWTCDFHLDVNTQMNYWPAYTTNLVETATPLNNWVSEQLVVSGYESAFSYYGINGWSAELVSNAYGYSEPYWAISLSPCPACGIWVLTHLWDYYTYTQEKGFLEKIAYPIFKGAIGFFLDYIFEDSKSCYLQSGPSISPENSFIIEGEVYYISNSPTFEILMIRELFKIYNDICEVLNVSNKELTQVKEAVKRLLPYRILEDGTVAEWSHDYPAKDEQHRHISHLLGLYPFYQITPENKELHQAAIKTLEKKMTPEDNWEDTGWARSMLMLYEARLHRGNHAYDHIKTMLDRLKDENSLIIHPPTRGAPSFANVYELDGNTGLTTCIAEMLLQSREKEIWILPALPDEWESGLIKGLKAFGNITVDIEWKKGVPTYIELISMKEDQDIILYYGNKKSRVYLKIKVPYVIST